MASQCLAVWTLWSCARKKKVQVGWAVQQGLTMHCCRKLLDAAGRRQEWDARSLQQTDLRRSLGVLDLLGLGVSSCAGVGVYVLSAYVTRNEAGPSSVLSVIIASVAALLAALCHAELAGRIPRAGTCYTYCYMTLGELSAFVVAWTMALDFALQSALAAKAWGHYLDFMVNDTIAGQMETLPAWQTSEVFARRPDVLACGFMLIISLSSFLSAKVFSFLTCTLSALSMLVLMAFVCVGYFHVQPHNWTQPPGFFTHGFTGVLSGASLLMTVFTGVDHAACASQETRHPPSRHLPSTLPLTSTLLFLLLFLPVSALTLACSWHDLPETAPIARAFQRIGIDSANLVIGVGAVLGLSASALVGVFHASRVFYSVAADGLLPAWFGRTSRASVPVLGGLLSGVMSAGLALTVELGCLVQMSALGTLVHFLLIAVVLLYVRYSPEPIGLCRDYSDLGLSSSARVHEEAVGEGEGGQQHCFRAVPTPPPPPSSSSSSNPAKLVLMANGDLHVHYHHHHQPHLNHHHHHHHHQSPDASPCCCCFPPSLLPSTRKTSSASEEEEEETSTLFPPGGGSGGGAGRQYDAADRYCCCCRCPRRAVAPRSTSSSSLSSLLLFPPAAAPASSSLSCCAAAVKVKVVPDGRSWQTTRQLLLVFLLSCTALAATTRLWPSEPASSAWWAVTLVCVSVTLLLVTSLGVWRQPQGAGAGAGGGGGGGDVRLFFRTPWVPAVPLMSVVVCSVLLAAVPALAWWRFALWTALGLLVYCVYGSRKKTHGAQEDQEVFVLHLVESDPRLREAGCHVLARLVQWNSSLENAQGSSQLQSKHDILWPVHPGSLVVWGQGNADGRRPETLSRSSRCVRVVNQNLQDKGIERMQEAARFPDLDPIEHVWDIDGRTVQARDNQPRT
ncbi:uncharacterized protein LOC143287774 [Babylonia areolata]|uniref:uncharacterized protein LOC143287774 n=1 Tax=Babylonia areolata TaxID=304850 RepID=UPI003FD61FC9